MAALSIGGTNSGEQKTPTLRQFIERNNGKFPLRSNVKIIFKPNEYGSYTFITDHNFRVQLEKGSSTAEEFEAILDDLIQEESTVMVIPIVEKKVSFQLAIDTDSNSEWKVMDWGFKCSLLPPKKTQTGRKKQQVEKTPPAEPPHPVM